MTQRDLLELSAQDWITIAGRGEVATFDGIPGLDPRTLRDQDVLIDGRRFHVQGVETYAVLDATGRNFGLLVRPALKEETCLIHPI